MATSVKINDKHRQEIRRVLLTKKFSERKGKVLARRRKLALRIYNRAFSAKDRAAMSALPSGWLPMVKTIKARLGTSDFGAELPEGHGPVPIPTDKYAYYEQSNFLIAVGVDDELSKEADELDRESRSILTEEDALSREINAVLYSVRTSNRLIVAWPEIEKIVEATCKTQAVNLPAPRVGYLNKELALSTVETVSNA